MKRGELWWSDLPVPVGSEPGFRRPVIVVQSEGFNKGNIKTVVAISVTSNLRLAQAPGNVLLPRSSHGLSRDSVANVSQVITLDKESLSEVIGKLDKHTMQQVDNGLRLVLSI